MSCGTFDAACHIKQAVAPVLVWLEIGGVVILAGVVLWVLAKLRQVFGWNGVWAGLVALAGLGGAILGSRSVSREPKIVTTIADRSTVKSIQLALASRGLYAGEIDGIYGVHTHEAVNAVERSLGIPLTPYDPEKIKVDRRVIEALGVRVGR